MFVTGGGLRRRFVALITRVKPSTRVNTSPVCPRFAPAPAPYHALRYTSVHTPRVGGRFRSNTHPHPPTSRRVQPGYNGWGTGPTRAYGNQIDFRRRLLIRSESLAGNGRARDRVFGLHGTAVVGQIGQPARLGGGRGAERVSCRTERFRNCVSSVPGLERNTYQINYPD